MRSAGAAGGKILEKRRIFGSSWIELQRAAVAAKSRASRQNRNNFTFSHLVAEDNNDRLF
jgi:hypothetical protein